eukprot:9262162-Pyramimonas_sp.AAC.1
MASTKQSDGARARRHPFQLERLRSVRGCPARRPRRKKLSSRTAGPQRFSMYPYPVVPSSWLRLKQPLVRMHPGSRSASRH